MVVVHRTTVVPAVCLTWRLQVSAGAAAVLLVPFLLVDGVAIATGGVGHRLHLGPQEDRRARSTGEVELDEVSLAMRISGRVFMVGLHPAVAAHHFALLRLYHALIPPFVEDLVVLGDFLP